MDYRVPGWVIWTPPPFGDSFLTKTLPFQTAKLHNWYLSCNSSLLKLLRSLLLTLLRHSRSLLPVRTPGSWLPCNLIQPSQLSPTPDSWQWCCGSQSKPLLHGVSLLCPGSQHGPPGPPSRATSRPLGPPSDPPSDSLAAGDLGSRSFGPRQPLWLSSATVLASVGRLSSTLSPGIRTPRTSSRGTPGSLLTCSSSLSVSDVSQSEVEDLVGQVGPRVQRSPVISSFTPCPFLLCPSECEDSGFDHGSRLVACGLGYLAWVLLPHRLLPVDPSQLSKEA